MGSREFEYREDVACGYCGMLGSYHIYGDDFCPICLDTLHEEPKEKKGNAPKGKKKYKETEHE
jgi:uncharacterized Zn finger protein (UPF0148 family)